METPAQGTKGNLTDDQLKELREAFDLFDQNKDGHITAPELQSVMKSLRLEPTDDELRNMIRQADIDGNGSVEFNEFIVMMSIVKERSEANVELKKLRQEAEVLQAFRVFDIDGDGLIDAQELKATMTNLGEMLSDVDVRAMIKAADKNDDGKIDFEEFLYMMGNDR